MGRNSCINIQCSQRKWENKNKWVKKGICKNFWRIQLLKVVYVFDFWKLNRYILIVKEDWTVNYEFLGYLVKFWVIVLFCYKIWERYQMLFV